MMTLVVQTKGGVGKSTTAMQAIAAWNLARLGSAKLIELDDQNHDAAQYTESAIKTIQHRVGAENLAEFSIEKLFLDIADENCIIDVGGNRTAEMTVTQIGDLGFDAMIDLIVIPVTSNGQDVVNARKTLELIREKMPHYEGKIALAMSRVPTTLITELEFLYFEAFDLAEEYEMAGPIVLPENQVFAMSRTLGMTVYEVSEAYESLSAKSRDAMRDAIKSRDKEQQRGVSRIKRIVENAKKVRADLDVAFDVLDGILSVDQKTKTKKTASAQEA